jgi:predicted permease
MTASAAVSGICSSNFMHTLFIKMLPLVLLALAGFILNHLKWIDAKFNHQLSLVLINVFYPCLIISSILRNFTWDTLWRNWMVPVCTALILVCGWLIGRLTLPLLKHKAEATRRSYLFTCLMNNYSFLPILMADALWGEGAVALIIFASLGAELCAWTIGIKTLTGGSLNREMLKGLFSLPMLALLASLLLLAIRSLCERHGCLPTTGGWVDELLSTVLDTCKIAGGATIPASALICGSRIAMLHPHRILSPLVTGSVFLRLVAIPAVCIAALLMIPLPPEVKNVLVLIAVMPTAMVSVTFAEVYGGDANYSAAAVLVSHIACLLTIPLWLWLIL